MSAMALSGESKLHPMHSRFFVFFYFRSPLNYSMNYIKLVMRPFLYCKRLIALVPHRNDIDYVN